MEARRAACLKGLFKLCAEAALALPNIFDKVKKSVHYMRVHLLAKSYLFSISEYRMVAMGMQLSMRRHGLRRDDPRSPLCAEE